MKENPHSTLSRTPGGEQRRVGFAALLVEVAWGDCRFPTSGEEKLGCCVRGGRLGSEAMGAYSQVSTEYRDEGTNMLR